MSSMLLTWHYGAKSYGSSTPPHLFPDLSSRDAPTGTMAIRAHPTIPSNLTHKQLLNSDTSILHALSSDTPTLTLQYWITTRSILPAFTQYFQESGYYILFFTTFSTEAAWTCLYPDHPISNTISIRHTKTATTTLTSLALSMPTFLTPATPPSYNYLSKSTVDPTMALIALMQQKIHQNSAIMAHMHSHPSLPSTPQPTPYQPYKPHLTPFPKWDGTPPITPLLLAQFATYKAADFYAGVHDWTQTTPARRHLSIAISADMLVLLPRYVS